MQLGLLTLLFWGQNQKESTSFFPFFCIFLLDAVQDLSILFLILHASLLFKSPFPSIWLHNSLASDLHASINGVKWCGISPLLLSSCWDVELAWIGGFLFYTLIKLFLSFKNQNKKDFDSVIQLLINEIKRGPRLSMYHLAATKWQQNSRKKIVLRRHALSPSGSQGEVREAATCLLSLCALTHHWHVYSASLST